MPDDTLRPPLVLLGQGDHARRITERDIAEWRPLWPLLALVLGFLTVCIVGQIFNLRRAGPGNLVAVAPEADHP